MIIQTEPKALILDHPEYGIPATAEIIGPWVEDGETVGQQLRYQGEHHVRCLRHDEIAALQEGQGEVGTEIRIKRRGNLYTYARRELGLAIVSEVTISRQRALEIYQNNQNAAAGAHVTGVVDFGSQACRWSWAIAYSEEDGA